MKCSRGAAVLLVAVAGMGVGGCERAPSDAYSPPTSTVNLVPTDPTGSSSATPPMSSVPPPTISRPTGPPTTPSDAISKRTLVGSATRHAAGCVLLTTDTGVWELTGDAAPDALQHPRVRVTGMPRPDVAPVCVDVPVLSVSAVAAA
jgi:hypothetical protein